MRYKLSCGSHMASGRAGLPAGLDTAETALLQQISLSAVQCTHRASLRGHLAEKEVCCGRCIQRADQPIILTGYAALNKLLGREVYTSHMQLGGPKVGTSR